MAFKASNLKSGYGRNAGKRWRGDDVLALRRLVNRGAPLRTISLKLGRPDSAIRSKAQAIGLSIEPEDGAPARRENSEPRHAPARAHRTAVQRQLELFG